MMAIRVLTAMRNMLMRMHVGRNSQESQRTSIVENDDVSETTLTEDDLANNDDDYVPDEIIGRNVQGALPRHSSKVQSQL